MVAAAVMVVFLMIFKTQTERNSAKKVTTFVYHDLQFYLSVQTFAKLRLCAWIVAF